MDSISHISSGRIPPAMPHTWEEMPPPSGLNVPPAAKHWPLAMQPHGIFSAENGVAQATSCWRPSRPASTSPYWMHRATSLDASDSRYTPMDPVAAQTCVERIGQRRGRVTLPDTADTFWLSFSGGYTFYSNGHMFIGASGGSSSGLPAIWESTQFATPHHSHLYAVRPRGIDDYLTEALKELQALWASPECPPQWTPAGRRQGGDA